MNLGAQLLAILDETNRPPDPKTIKEYECVFRQRLEAEWLRIMDDARTRGFIARVLHDEQSFRAVVRLLEVRLLALKPSELVRGFPFDCTEARRAALGRAALTFGNREVAEQLVAIAMAVAPESATTLKAELASVGK